MKKLKSFILKTSLFLNPLFLINFSFANDFRDNKGNPSFFFAVEAKDVERIENLIALGFDVNERDDRGQTPLHYASRYGILNKVVKALLKAGAEVNATDKNGYTPLHITSLYGSDNLDVMKTLLEAKAEVNVKDNKGNTPLYWAVVFQRIDKVKVLLEFGADPSIKNKNEGTPYDIDIIRFAERVGRDIAVLLKKAEEIRNQNKCRETFGSVIIS
ncbi:MAG: ankyrin repeat domain-containing protein [Bdellovibrionales bacterium]|nr:ankyrin repeat domain-containing protein [Bdellovibrionales bacterium]